MEREGAKAELRDENREPRRLASWYLGISVLTVCAMIRLMQHVHPARSRFRALIRRPEPQLDLAEAALCIAWEDQGAGGRQARCASSMRWPSRPAALAGLTQPERYCQRAQQLSVRRARVSAATPGSYNDPANSFLDRVLATRAGLPITLSVIYMEVGWRLGLPIAGVALPGHFLARYWAWATTRSSSTHSTAGGCGAATECETQIATFYGSVTPR